VAAKAKQILGEPVEREKRLSLSRGRNPSHMSLTLPRGFVRHFRTIVGVNVIEVFHGRHDRTINRIIASQFIRDQPSRLAEFALE
jgi:hypothetical protein